jgi:probable F420-dependent oxidoreductase
MVHTMRVGITAYDMSGRDLLALAVVADELGFDALWLGEHVVLPVAYTTEHPTKPDGGDQHHTGPIVSQDTDLLDPLVELGAIASVTRHLQLCTGIYIVPLRHPLLTARSAATLHEVSGGRLVMGVGIGWLTEEFKALGVPFAERVGRFDESIEVLRQAWAGGPFEHRGVHFSFGQTQVTPHPIDVPLVLGGNTDRALRRAATMGDGWFSSGTPTFDDARRMRDRLQILREQHDRTHPFRCYFRVERCDPALVERYRADGIEDIALWADQIWVGDTLEDKRRTLEEAAMVLELRTPHPGSR